jgi:hypothetical protein
VRRLLTAAVLAGLAAGCGDKELPPTTDPGAIQREQDRLRGQNPGATKGVKDNAIQREQDRLRSKP